MSVLGMLTCGLATVQAGRARTDKIGTMRPSTMVFRTGKEIR